MYEKYDVIFNSSEAKCRLLKSNTRYGRQSRVPPSAPTVAADLKERWNGGVPVRSIVSKNLNPRIWKMEYFAGDNEISAKE